MRPGSQVAIAALVAYIASAAALTIALAASACIAGDTPSATASPSSASDWAPKPGMAAYEQNAAAGPAAAPSAASAHSPTARPDAIASQPSASGSIDGAGAREDASGLDHVDHQWGRSDLTPGQRALYTTHDASFFDPVSWAVMVFKSRYELVVYYKGRMYRSYHAVFGRSQDHGTKLWEGDRRTPEGVYTIVGKHPSQRWHWFLALNYPNLLDRRRYDELRGESIIPIHDGHPAGEGGHIGIHGTDNPLLNTGNVNWTTGCISVDNRDISELDRILPIGTVVIIKP